MNIYHLDDVPEHLKGYFEPVPQIGLEPSPDQFVATMVALFREARRVLREDGVLWLNLGDSYASSPAGNFGPNMTAPANGGRYRANKPKMKFNIAPKNLLGMPWRVALALQADGWILRSDVIWSKPNPMPESVTDRPTKAHEYCFLLTKSGRYWWDAEAVRSPASHSGKVVSLGEKSFSRGQAAGANVVPSGNGKASEYVVSASRNLRTVWEVATEPTPFAHFATFPRKLIEPMIKAGCPKGGLVLDPFIGSGTTGLVARSLGRDYVGCDLNLEYVKLAQSRLELPLLDLIEQPEKIGGGI